ncbi:MAG: 3-methyl-2-oxobutanoate dehydrogenase subunit VorB [Deltaproteobacteria bacterium]|jgi:2-oxoglutarate ferredoxin oxidoreductase subunit alpha|nr:3-methyl-2-oxobutanoate dehydrogenase subunit VorB [Deltaproteobacteria bacterium]
MGDFKFIKGNEAAAEAAIRAGCEGFFFYPVTPSSEIGEYMANHLHRTGGVFAQAESEIAAVNMMFGGAATGARVMTGTSGVGYSLMSECISYMAGAEVPAVIVDVMRAGPGLGSLEPTQGDYNQVTKASGHGGHIIPVYAPSNAQEIVNFVHESFGTAERFRTPVVVLYDGYTGQVMESVEFPEGRQEKKPNTWSLDDAPGRKGRVVRSGYAGGIGQHSFELYAKYDDMKEKLQRFEEYQTEDAEIILVGFGIVGRICKSVVDKARDEGLKVGLIRPIMISPFPAKAFAKYKGTKVKFLTIEMSYGQMCHDVALAVGENDNTHFFRDKCGSLPAMSEILNRLRQLKGENS